MQLGKVDIADQCCIAYEGRSRHYTGPAADTLEPRDQLNVRWHYLRGLVSSARTRPFKGQALIDGTLASIKHILAGLKVRPRAWGCGAVHVCWRSPLDSGCPTRVQVASASARYQFLVYNGSVHYWHVSRPLQRVGLRSQIVESFSQVLQALAQLPGHAAWRGRLQSAYGMALFEAGKVDDAIKALQDASDLAKSTGDAQLTKQVTQMKAHVGQARASPSASAPCNAGRWGKEQSAS